MRLIRSIIILIIAFMTIFPVPGFASSIHVTWDANSESDLAGYYVYYGTQSGTYGSPIQVISATSYDIPDVQSGVTYYVAVSAYDTSYNESEKSTEVSLAIPDADTTPPTGSVSINSGASSTTSTSVTLTLSATDAAGSVTGMKFSNDGVTYSSEVAYTTSYSWTLSSALGTKTVYVLFKDSAGNWMASPCTDTITLSTPADTTPPTGSVVINSGAANTTSTSVTLTLAANDAAGSVAGMKISNDGATYSSEITYATSYPWTLSGSYGSKTVYVLYKDNSGNWMTSPVTDTIQYVSPNPVAEAGANQTLAPQRVVLDGSASYDPAGQTLQYSWSFVSGPAQVTVETPTAASASFMGIKAGTYQFSLTCSNGSYSSSDTTNVTIQNVAPSVSAGNNMTIDVGTQITLHATGQDSNQDSLTYYWTKVSGPSVSLPSLAQQDITFTPTIAGMYTFTAQCYDGVNYSATSQVIVTVNAINHAPTANAGINQDVNVGSTVTLDGSGSSDPDGDALAYTWVKSSGPQVTLTGANTVRPTFVASIVGTYIFSLTVNDGKVSSTASSVTIRVLSQNNPPVANAGADVNAYVGEDVVLDASNSYDPDLDTITYSWTQVSGASVIINNANTATPFFTPTTSGSFEFKVSVSDGQATSTDNVIVTVENQNQVPIANAGSNITATVSQTVTLDGSASYDPDGTAISYIWTQISGTSVSLGNSNTASPSFAATQVGVYVFELKVYDGIDTSVGSSVTVTVQNSSTSITLVSPSNNEVCYASPILTWAGSNFKSYAVYIAIDGGKKYSKVYNGSSTSTTLHPVLWQWFIPSGTSVTWYVQGTTNSGQAVKSAYGTFRRN